MCSTRCTVNVVEKPLFEHLHEAHIKPLQIVCNVIYMVKNKPLLTECASLYINQYVTLTHAAVPSLHQRIIMHALLPSSCHVCRFSPERFFFPVKNTRSNNAPPSHVCFYDMSSTSDAPFLRLQKRVKIRVAKFSSCNNVEPCGKNLYFL